MSFDVFTELATDESKENNGTWFPFGADSKLLIARNGNQAYAKKLTELAEQNRVLLDAKGKAADDLSEKIMVEVVASTILLGWEGLAYKGKDLEYSVDNAKLLLGVREFRRQVVALSQEFSAYKLKEEVAQGEA